MFFFWQWWFIDFLTVIHVLIWINTCNTRQKLPRSSSKKLGVFLNLLARSSSTRSFLLHSPPLNVSVFSWAAPYSRPDFRKTISQSSHWARHKAYTSSEFYFYFVILYCHAVFIFLFDWYRKYYVLLCIFSQKLELVFKFFS